MAHQVAAPSHIWSNESSRTLNAVVEFSCTAKERQHIIDRYEIWSVLPLVKLIHLSGQQVQSKCP